MGLMDNLRNYFGSKVEVVNKYNEAFFWGGNFTKYDTESKTYIESGYNVNPIVYSVVNQQATKAKSIPLKVKKIENPNQKQKLDQFDRMTKGEMTPQQRVKRMVMESKAYSDEEIMLPMERPNINQTWAEFVDTYEMFLSLTGNAYLYMLSPEMGMNAGEPIQFYVLPSHLMQIVLKDNASTLSVESPVKGYMLISGKSYLEFEEKNVIHIKYANPNYDDNGGHLYGQSPLQSALRNIQSSNTALDLNIKALKSGGAFGLIHGKGQQAMRPEQANQLKERLKEMNTDPGNLGKIAGVSSEIGFTRISLTTDELKPFDYLGFDQKQICNVLGWNDLLLNNDSGAKYDNVNNARKEVISNKIMPDLKLLEEALNSKFLPRFKKYANTCLYFDFTELPEMQEDIVEMSTWLNSALDRGVISRNEYRMAISYSSVENTDMDEFTTSADVLKLSEAINDNFNLNESI